MKNSLFSIFRESAKTIAINPIIILPTFLLWIFLFILSRISIKVNYLIGNGSSLLIIIWLIIFFILIMLAISYFSACLIIMSLSSIKASPKMEAFSKARSYLWRNFLILLTLFIAGVGGINLLLYLFSKIVMSTQITLSLLTYQIILFIIAIAWLLCIVIFLTFSNVILIYESTSFIKSIKKSTSFVKSNYFKVLLVSVVFYIIIQLAQLLPTYSLGGIITLSDFILFIIVYPFTIIFLTRFFTAFNKK
jgi:hypothetical protein